MVFKKRISPKKKIMLALCCFPILLIVLYAISDHSLRIAMDELVNLQSVTSVEVFFPLDEKKPVIFSKEEEGALLHLLSSVTLTPISEEEILLRYGGPPYIRLCSDREPVLLRIYEEKCFLGTADTSRYYCDLSGDLAEAGEYVLRILRDAR